MLRQIGSLGNKQLLNPPLNWLKPEKGEKIELTSNGYSAEQAEDLTEYEDI